jgi:peptidoglycan hydrolase-like protein with peptidoglycan-binding domain
MSQHPSPNARARLRRPRTLLGALVATTLAAAALVVPVGAAQAATRATPGNFTGYGFDQCLAPTQSAMDAWLRSSPFWAVGIYISGDSRGCRNQPNLTPTWVRTQLAHGWRLLPITLGPQASCNPRFPRYHDDVRISPSSTDRYLAARRQGRQEASKTVTVARGLGIVTGSTLWYDMEAYDTGNTACRESALSFLSAWTRRLHALDYVSGVYSSAASGIRALDDARVNRPGTYAMPDQVWIADWDQKASTSSTYVRSDGWRPGGRVKQYDGGHNETHGGVAINIDSDFLDLGRGSTPRAEPDHCGGTRLNYARYPALRTDSTGTRVVAAQCLLKQAGAYTGPLDGTMSSATQDAVLRFRSDHGLPARRTVSSRVWTALLSQGSTPLIKYGAASEMVRRLQRALNAASSGLELSVTGTFAGATTAAVKDYQARLGLARTGVVTPRLWHRLQRGDG